MKHKRLIIIGISSLVLAVAGLAAVSQTDTYKRFRDGRLRILKAVLTPGQLDTLLDFRKAHQAEREAWREDRGPGPAELWRELKLTEDQQDRLLSIADSNVDAAAPLFQQVALSVTDLKNAALAANPESDDFQEYSTKLGDNLAEAAVFASRVSNQVRAVLTPEQIAVLDEHRAERKDRINEALDKMPAKVGELVGLWGDLALTPGQVDALSSLHADAGERRSERFDKIHEKLRESIEPILDERQLEAFQAFHDAEMVPARARHEARAEERDAFREELALTGEQKIQLVNLMADNRDRIELSVRLVAQTAMDLADRVLAPEPDETSIRLAAHKMGEASGFAAMLGAQLARDAQSILTPEQYETLKAHSAGRDGEIAGHFDEMPGRVHRFIAMLDELALTPQQKDAIADALEQMHMNRHHGFHMR